VRGLTGVVPRGRDGGPSTADSPPTSDEAAPTGPDGESGRRRAVRSRPARAPWLVAWFSHSNRCAAPGPSAEQRDFTGSSGPAPTDGASLPAHTPQAALRSVSSPAAVVESSVRQHGSIPCADTQLADRVLDLDRGPPCLGQPHSRTRRPKWGSTGCRARRSRAEHQRSRLASTPAWVDRSPMVSRDRAADRSRTRRPCPAASAPVSGRTRRWMNLLQLQPFRARVVGGTAGSLTAPGCASVTCASVPGRTITANQQFERCGEVQLRSRASGTLGKQPWCSPADTAYQSELAVLLGAGGTEPATGWSNSSTYWLACQPTVWTGIERWWPAMHASRRASGD